MYCGVPARWGVHRVVFWLVAPPKPPPPPPWDTVPPAPPLAPFPPLPNQPMLNMPAWDQCNARSDYDDDQAMPVLRLAYVKVPLSTAWFEDGEGEQPELYVVGRCSLTPS